MYKTISSTFEKMGNWYGIIFKMILPFVVMYRPIKTLAFSFVLIDTLNGGNSYASSNSGVVVFCILYVIFALLLILFPKAASATEFFLIAWYLIFLISIYIISLNNESWTTISHILSTYSRELPLVIVFLAGKIFVFFFIKTNSKEYEKEQARKKHLFQRS